MPLGQGSQRALGTEPLSEAKRSRRADEGSVPMAWEAVSWLICQMKMERMSLRRAHALQEQSLYSGKARSSAGGIKRG